MKDKKRKKREDKPISLYPLEPEEVIKKLLKTKPPPKKKKKNNKKQ